VVLQFLKLQLFLQKFYVERLRRAAPIVTARAVRVLSKQKLLIALALSFIGASIVKTIATLYFLYLS
jgi:hypothetical protein